MKAQCKYCLEFFEAKRSTASFCKDSHRALFSRLSEDEKKQRDMAVAFPIEQEMVTIPKSEYEELKGVSARIVKKEGKPVAEIKISIPDVAPSGLKFKNKAPNVELPQKEADAAETPQNKQEYDFGDDRFLVIEKYTKFPLKDMPSNKGELITWSIKKRNADHEIKIAWNEHLKNKNG